jgi:hypothetical protein
MTPLYTPIGNAQTAGFYLVITVPAIILAAIAIYYLWKRKSKGGV